MIYGKTHIYTKCFVAFVCFNRICVRLCVCVKLSKFKLNSTESSKTVHAPRQKGSHSVSLLARVLFSEIASFQSKPRLQKRKQLTVEFIFSLNSFNLLQQSINSNAQSTRYEDECAFQVFVQNHCGVVANLILCKCFSFT